MAMIQGIRIRNFKSLKDITLGNVCDGSNTQPLTPITAVIGKNGVGKTSLFDVFGFLADCMKYGVAEACDVRGGFDRVVSQGEENLIELVLCYKPESDSILNEFEYDDSHQAMLPLELPAIEPESNLMKFELTITRDTDNNVYVKRERLRRCIQKNNVMQIFTILALNSGKGIAWKGDDGQILDDKNEDDEIMHLSIEENRPGEWRHVNLVSFSPSFDRPKLRYAIIDPATGKTYHPPNNRTWRFSQERMQELIDSGRVIFPSGSRGIPVERRYITPIEDTEFNEKDKSQLATATLAKTMQHPRLSAFRDFVEGWYLSYFTPDAARNVNQKGAQPHLNRSGDNLSNVVEFMEREHPERFQTVLERIASKIPDIGKISTYRDSISKNLYLMFEGKGFSKPFTQSQMSDGTLKLFTYLLLLEDPEPAPLLCIEEPENGLYHQLLETLAQEIREHTSKGNSQVFITTHQPYFVDALEPEEVWILEKGADGFSTIRRASDDPLINAMVEESQPLGALWYSGYLDAR